MSKADNEELKEAIKRLENDKNKPLSCGDITIVNLDDIETVLKGLKRLQEDYIEKDKIREKIEEMQEEYNKLDKQVDEYINDSKKDLNKYYENKEKISTMQTISWATGKIEELLEGK